MVERTTTVSEPFVHTASGLAFPFLNPRADLVRLDDIAHGLAGISRYCGKHRTRQSVAMHSVLVRDMLAREQDDGGEMWPLLGVAALLHDAAEVYIGDLPSPVKARFPGFSIMEDAIMLAVGEACGLPDGIFAHPALKRADKYAMLYEVGVHIARVRMSAGSYEEGDPRAAVILSQVDGMEPEHYGLPEGTEWPDGDALSSPTFSTLLDDTTQAAPRARLLWVMAMEREVRAIASTHPRVAERLEALLDDAAVRNNIFVKSSPWRLFAGTVAELAVPQFIADGMNEFTRDIITQTIRGDEGQRDLAMCLLSVGHQLSERCSAAARMVLENQPGTGPDQDMLREDPARALREFETEQTAREAQAKAEAETWEKIMRAAQAMGRGRSRPTRH